MDIENKEEKIERVFNEFCERKIDIDFDVSNNSLSFNFLGKEYSFIGTYPKTFTNSIKYLFSSKNIREFIIEINRLLDTKQLININDTELISTYYQNQQIKDFKTWCHTHGIIFKSDCYSLYQYVYNNPKLVA
jgi:hypothetical protein